jgi:hypothetical protein
MTFRKFCGTMRLPALTALALLLAASAWGLPVDSCKDVVATSGNCSQSYGTWCCPSGYLVQSDCQLAPVSCQLLSCDVWCTASQDY